MKRFLKCVERILMAVLSAFASVGAFVLINLIINLVSDEPLSVGNMGIWFMVSMILVYCLIKLLAEVRYERLEILAEELKNQTEESEELYEHLRVK